MPDKNKFKELIMTLYAPTDEVWFVDDYDECIIGFDPNAWKVVYSRKKCLDKLTLEDGLSWDEANDHLEYNVFGSYVGEKTPIFVEEFKWDWNE